MDDLRQRLQETDRRIGLHASRHLDHRFAFHQAVGVENDQEFVAAAGGAQVTSPLRLRSPQTERSFLLH